MKYAASAALLAASVAAGAAPLAYEIDPNHTFPSFEADHMGISVWRGKLTANTGKVVLDRAAQTGTVDITIDTSAIDFGQAQLNQWARGEDFFDIAKFGKDAHYRGKLTNWVNGAPTAVDGALTLHGVTRPVPLSLKLLRCIPHPMLKRELCGADARGSFQRDAFGLTAGKDYGFKMEVALRIQVEAIAAQ